MVEVDMVEHPPHYAQNDRAIECIEYIQGQLGDGFDYYLEGTIIKYLHRYRHKEKPLEDLQKMRWYLDRLIEEHTREI